MMYVLGVTLMISHIKIVYMFKTFLLLFLIKNLLFRLRLDNSCCNDINIRGLFRNICIRFI